MRRFILGAVATGGVAVALACGNQIDTSITPGSSSGTSGTITLPDGAVVASSSGTTSGSVSSSSGTSGTPTCSNQHIIEDFMDVGPNPWTPLSNEWVQSNPPPMRTTNGTDPPFLQFIAGKSADQYLAHPLDALCKEVSVTIEFKYDQKYVTFLQVTGGSSTKPESKLSIRFQLNKFYAILDDSPEQSALYGGTTPGAADYVTMKAIFSTNGEIRLAFDADDPRTGTALFVPKAPLDLTLGRIQVGALSAATDNTFVEMRKIDIQLH